MSAARTVAVGGASPYRIEIGPDLLHDGERLAAHARGRHVLLVSDSNVAPLYAAAVAGALRQARSAALSNAPASPKPCLSAQTPTDKRMRCGCLAFAPTRRSAPRRPFCATTRRACAR